MLRLGWRVTVLGVVANGVLIAVKLAAGIFGNSQALVADAVHSISDFASDGIVLFGLKAGRKAPDEDHPFGHGRIETMAAAAIGLFLVAVAVLLAVDAAGNLATGKLSNPTPLALVAAALSVVTKEVLYQITVRAGRRARSTVVVANAWHHRTDAMSSVAVLVGVGAAQLDPAWRVFDAGAAILVAAFILRVAGGILATAVREFTDTAPPTTVIDRMGRIACGVEGVQDVHDLKVRTSGGQYLVQVHITVDGTLSVASGHDIGTRVADRLSQEVDAVADVIVHVDPSTG
jgi:cation diffusion facilitator family transporter